MAIAVVTDLQGLLSMLKGNWPAVLIANLDALGARINDFGGPAREKRCTAVGYYSHVNAQVAEGARRAGFDVVLPRGAFVAKMAETLRKIIPEQGV